MVLATPEAWTLFQSTRPRRARPYRVAHHIDPPVSIHAPAKGATVGADTREAAEHVSIHAPAKGATCGGQYSRTPTICFNPRAREGRDVIICVDDAIIHRFQSTRPRRARPWTMRRLPSMGVSIHAPAKGATGAYLHALGRCVVSIHAPAKGATILMSPDGLDRQVSIHAPAKGATLVVIRRAWRVLVSIHAPAKGATQGRLSRSSSRSVSIHAPAKGATNPRSPSNSPRSSFNPRAREGRDYDTRVLIM